jgi:hypothetical protein
MASVIAYYVAGRLGITAVTLTTIAQCPNISQGDAVPLSAPKVAHRMVGVVYAGDLGILTYYCLRFGLFPQRAGRAAQRDRCPGAVEGARADLRLDRPA